jgi:hypothetical protein
VTGRSRPGGNGQIWTLNAAGDGLERDILAQR